MLKKKKPYQIQITKERKCIGIESNMISVENYKTKMVTNSRLTLMGNKKYLTPMIVKLEELRAQTHNLTSPL